MRTLFLFFSYKSLPVYLLLVATLLSTNWVHSQESNPKNVIYLEYQILGNIGRADLPPIADLPYYDPQFQALDLIYKRRVWFSSKLGLSMDGHFGSAGSKLPFGSFKTGAGTTLFIGKSGHCFEMGFGGYKVIEKRRQKWQFSDGGVLTFSSGWRFDFPNDLVLQFGIRIHSAFRKMRSTEFFFGPYLGVGRIF